MGDQTKKGQGSDTINTEGSSLVDSKTESHHDRSVHAGGDIVGSVVVTGDHANIRQTLRGESSDEEEEVVDGKQFQQDVVEILGALVDAKEKLEQDFVTLQQMFARLMLADVDGKSVEQARTVVSDALTTEELASIQTLPQQLGDRLLGLLTNHRVLSALFHSIGA